MRDLIVSIGLCILSRSSIVVLVEVKGHLGSPEVKRSKLCKHIISRRITVRDLILISRRITVRDLILGM